MTHVVRDNDSAGKPAWFKSDACGFLLVAVIGLLVYSNTFQVPWYFDDLQNIVENMAIRNLREAWSGSLGNRGLAMWTFALNYRFNGLAVTGYHVVNLAIHIGTAWTTLLILKRVCRTSWQLPLLGALLFVVHPLQTQAVTYIVQRMTCLSGLFFFLSLYLYIRAREALNEDGRIRPRPAMFYAAALFCGVFAVLTKQNAVILPLAIWLFDAYFLPRPALISGKRLVYLLPFCVAPLVLVVQQVFLPLFHGADLVQLGRAQRLSGLHNVTPFRYLVTEFSVIWLYIRLLFLPYRQALEYGYPIVETILGWKNFIALAGICGLGWLGYRCRRKAALISFGIFWFFLGLAVESTFIPLDPVFEHRLYVSLFGFVVVVIGLLQLKLSDRQVQMTLMPLILVFAVTAWQRNAQWTDPIAFYEDNVRLVPHSERASVGLALKYKDAGRTEEALKSLERARQINPDFIEVYVNLSNLYIILKKYDLALEMAQRGLQIEPVRFDLVNNIGSIYARLGQPEKAIEYLERAILIRPDRPIAYLNLGAVHEENGRLDQAITYYRKAVALSRNNYPLAHYNLGVVYYRQNRKREAQSSFQLSMMQNPKDAEALYNYAVVSVELGERAPAANALPVLRQLNERLAAELENVLARQ